MSESNITAGAEKAIARYEAMPSADETGRIAFTASSTGSAFEYFQQAVAKIRSDEGRNRIMQNTAKTGEHIAALMVAGQFITDAQQAFATHGAGAQSETEEGKVHRDAILAALGPWQEKIKEINVSLNNLLCIAEGLEPKTPEELEAEIGALTAAFAQRLKPQALIDAEAAASASS